MGLAVSVPLLAQVAESVLSLDDGTRVKAIARLVGGRWVAADSTCVPPDTGRNPSARERLTVSGAIQLVPVRAVVSGSPEWLRLAPTIVEIFDRREREQRLLPIGRPMRRVRWTSSTSPRAAIAACTTSKRRGVSRSASADVDHDTDPPGTVRIAVAGFLHDTRARLVPLGTKSELRWEQDGLPARPEPARPHASRHRWPRRSIGLGHEGAVRHQHLVHPL